MLAGLGHVLWKKGSLYQAFSTFDDALRRHPNKDSHQHQSKLLRQMSGTKVATGRGVSVALPRSQRTQPKTQDARQTHTQKKVHARTACHACCTDDRESPTVQGLLIVSIVLESQFKLSLSLGVEVLEGIQSLTSEDVHLQFQGLHRHPHRLGFRGYRFRCVFARKKRGLSD